MKLQFWGTRGTFPVPGEKTLRYGGNTNCVTVTFPDGRLWIFDAGSGFKALSSYLLRKNSFPLRAKLFLSHAHWDHINGIPVFAPFYMEGNTFEIYGMDPKGGSLKEIFSYQMDGTHFPVTPM